MKFKTLLLGTAAAFAVAGGAQAADLAVAESVEYVKVCDAYGAGYFYIPGSDVCLKIGGYVQFRTYFYDESKSLNYDDTYTASWKFYTESSLAATAKWMTDWGAATVFLDYRAFVDESSVNHKEVFVDAAWLKIGGLKLGRDTSTYDYGIGGTTLIGPGTDFDHDEGQQQVQWSTTFGGIGFFAAVEDPRENVGASGYYTGDMPDIVVALAGSAGAFDWKWSAGVTDTIYGTGWGTQIGLGWSQGGNWVKLQAAVSNDAGAPYGANWAPNGAGGTPWHVSASGGIAWTSAFTTAIFGGYREQGAVNEWEIAAEADWTIAKGVVAGIAVDHNDHNILGTTTTVEARVKASF
jgi:hypothetical protein